MAWKLPPLPFVQKVGDLEIVVNMNVLEPGDRAKAMKAAGLTRFQWNDLKKRVGSARAAALQRAGMDVRRAAQRTMSNRTPTFKPKFMEGGTKGGVRLVIKRYQVSKSDRVTSWKTDQHPKGFLRSDIYSDYDRNTQSVVIGPRKAPKLNKLHEIGGTVSLWFNVGVTPRFAPARMKGAIFGTLTNYPQGRTQINPSTLKEEKYTEDLSSTFFWGRRRVKARRYMQTGLDNARDKIPAAFQDFIQRPGGGMNRQGRLF